MEGRKLQRAGKSTFLVSLPKRWVTTAGLKAGDTLFVAAQSDGSVSVRPPAAARPAVRRKVFDETAPSPPGHLGRKLIGAYVAGFGLIELRFPPERGPAVRQVVRDFCRRAIGPEVIEETRSSLVVRDLSDPAELGSEKCLRRMHLAVRAMLDDAVAAFGPGGVAQAREVALRSTDVHRLHWMVAKQSRLADVGPPVADRASRGELHSHRLVARRLERIAERAEAIAAAAVDARRDRTSGPPLAGRLDAARASAIAILDRAFLALMGRDLDAAQAAIDARAEHERLLAGLPPELAGPQDPARRALGTAVVELGRIAVDAVEIAEEAIGLAVLLEPAAS